MTKWMATFAMLCVTLSTMLGPVCSATAEEKGLEDLDKATELQLNAETLGDLERVTDLCEKALEKGLNDGNQKFAKQLLASTLLAHAQRLSATVLEQPRPGRNRQALLKTALSDLDKAIKYDADSFDIHLLRAKLQAIAGDNREGALKSATEAARLAKDDNKQLAEALLIRAQLHTEDNKRLADFDGAIKADPTSVEAWQARAMFHLSRGENEKAVADINHLLEQNKENPIAHFALAEALSNLKRFDEALEHVAQGIKLAPNAPIGHLLRSRIHTMQGNLAAAVEALTESLKNQPRDPQALMMRSRLHVEMGEMEKAVKDIDRVLDILPDSAEAILFRSTLYLREKRYAEAIADVGRLLKENPDNSKLQLHVARLYTAGGWPRKALAIAQQIVKVEPENWQALQVRADTNLSIGNHKEAAADFAKIVELTEQNKGGEDDDDEETLSSVLNNYAWLLSTSTEDSVRNAKRSIELGTKACELTEYKKAHILSTLASGYAEAGDWESAVKWSSKAVELGDGEVKEQLEKELASYKEKKPWREKQETEEQPNPPKLPFGPEL